ncbi:MAG: glycosyltransferase family 39 protein [Candidatus Krumholzibacteriota bacterium]
MLPILLSEGTFLDGLIYAILARNLAAGVGSFWAPHFSVTTQNQWFEHPPLGLNIQSVFYRLLGEGVWVEQVHSLVTGLVCGVLIVVLWRQVTARYRPLRPLVWLPVLLWLMNPQVTWAFSNNMLENTMTIFTLAAVIMLLRSCRDGRFRAVDLLLGAAAIVAAFFTKGFAGLFPLGTLLAYQIGTGQPGWRRTAGRTFLLVACVAALAALVLAIPAARHNIGQYLDIQFLSSLKGARGDSGNRFIYLSKLLNTLLPMLGATFLVALLGWRKRVLSAVGKEHLGWALTFLLLALAGSVPLVVSPRQSVFYVLTSFPFYGMAAALSVAGIVAELVGRLEARPRMLRVMQVVAVLLLVAATGLSATKIGTYNRSETLTRDVKVIGAYVRSAVEAPAGSEYEVGVCRRLWTDWPLESNLARYHRLAMARNDSTMPFVLVLGGCADDLGADYQRVDLATGEYDLYARRTSPQPAGGPGSGAGK